MFRCGPRRRVITSLRHIWSLIIAALLAGSAGGAPSPDRSDAETESAGKILRLGGVTFDPLHAGPVFPARLAKASDSKSDLRLVQFRDPVRDVDRVQLRERGIELVQYIHPDTYITWADPEQMRSVQRLPAVRWSGDFAPACRLLPHLRGRGESELEVRIMIYRGADVGGVVRALHDLEIGTVKRRRMDAKFEVLGCSVRGSVLEQVATIPGVYSVQPVARDGGNRGELANQLNTGLYENSNLVPGYYEWLTSVGFTGTGVTLACVDTGVSEQAPDLVSRITDCVGESCGDSTTQSSHGTLSAGAMVGDAASGIVDPWEFLAGQGTAPRARMLEQLYDPIFTEPDGMLRLMRDSRSNGASASNNSWGPSPTPLGYDIDTRLVDVGVRDALADEDGNQGLTYVLSIMNGNGGTSSQGTPDEAMNVIRVGATRLRSNGGTLQNHVEDLAAVSAHGPCLDGRMLPDLVAPGCYVLSIFDEFNWAYSCGTSLASPQVTGAAGLFCEYYRNRIGLGRDPSPAMTKAAILIAARSLEGGEDADGAPMGHPPDSRQGWGRLAIDPLINPDAEGIRYYDQATVFGESGEEWSLQVEPQDPTQPIRVMLVWTTAAGHGLGGSTPAWTNDLDLVVEAGGGTYVGNDIDPSTGWSRTGGTADYMNNTEAVLLGPVAPSTATIRVVASDINSDGVPGFGDASDQDFALVCMNCKADSFSLTLDPPAIEVCAPGTVEYTVEVLSASGATDAVALSALGPLGVSLSLQNEVVTPPEKTTLSVTVPIGMSGTKEFSVIGTSAGEQVEVVGQLVVVSPFSTVPDLLEPSDGASGLPTIPTLSWSMDGASSFDVELASDALFGDVLFSATTSEQSITVDAGLSYGETYHWRVRPSSSCGNGSWSWTSSFTTSEGISVLLVDDDDNVPDVRSYYTEAMSSLGLQYEVWDTANTDEEPGIETLRNYDLVVWFTGAEWGGFAGPGADSEIALEQWLLEGGVLWLSSQDYLYDRGLNAFGSTYLGVSAYDSDVGQNVVTGAGSVFGGYGTMTLTCPFNNYTDSIEVTPDAELAFVGDLGGAGATVVGDGWRTVFWAFPLEAVLDVDVRRSLMLTVVNWVPVPEPVSCPADVSPDGVVNIQDLLMVIASWGGGPEGDVDGDGTVDVADLLMIISSWGLCS